MSLQKPGLGSTYVTRVEVGPQGEARKLLAFVGEVSQLSGEEKTANFPVAYVYMGVSKNRGKTPKWMVYNGKPY